MSDQPAAAPISKRPAQAARPNPAGPLEFLWRALNSLPVAIFVMLALTLLSALGTLVPQEHLNPQPAMQTFPEFMAQRYGEQKFQVLHFLGFDHIYFTWYFNTLLTWLAVSAVICNIVRWRTTWRLWKTPVVRRGARFFQADRRSWLFAGRTDTAPVGASAIGTDALANVSPAEVETALADDLRLLGYRVRHEGDGEARTLYADKGFAKKWALVLLHIAILILLFGGFYGRAVGLNGNIRLANGEQQALTLNVAKGKYKWVQPWLQLLPQLTYELHQHTFRIDWGKKIVLETQYNNVPQELQEYYWYYVDDYVSDLEVSRGKRTVHREVKVNHPLVIDKLVVYQSGYEQHGYLKVNGGGQTREVRIPDPLFGKETWYGITASEIVIWNPAQDRWFIPELRGDDVVMHFVETSTVGNIAFMVAEPVHGGDLYVHDRKAGRIGPMAIFTLRARDGHDQQQMGSLLVTGSRPFELEVGGASYSVGLSEKLDDYSVFAYKRDPGSPILFAGWLLLVAGIALTMYMPFTQLWARAEPGALSVLTLGPDARRLRKRLDAMLGIEAS